MGIGKVAGQIPAGFGQGAVALAYQAGEVVDGEQPLADGARQRVLAKVRGEAVLPHRDGDIHLALAHLGQAVLGPLLVAQPYPGSAALELIEVEGGEQGEGAVHAGDDELPLRTLRVEGRGLQQGVEAEQDGLQLLLQCQGAGSGIQAIGGADEEGIVEGLPQPSQGLADRGLAQMQAAGGPAAVALLQQHLQYDEQVEIGAGQLFQKHGL